MDVPSGAGTAGCAVYYDMLLLAPLILHSLIFQGSFQRAGTAEHPAVSRQLEHTA